MSERWIILAMRAKSAEEAFLPLLNAVSSIGLSLEYPGSNAVKVLDNVGEDHDFSRKAFLELLKREQHVSFQWWWDDLGDTYCRIEVTSGIALVKISLDGHDHRQEDLVVSCLRSLYDSLADRHLALGMFVDQLGMTILYSWRDIFTGRQLELEHFPDELIVPRKLGDQLVVKAPYRVVFEERGDSLVIHRSE